MPLLKKKPFKKKPQPEDLCDEDEIFYCPITDEIFRDYSEFSESVLLYNSMIWTCSMTGKTNLTFNEALESEKNAEKILVDFPSELKVPILFLASKTQRTSFLDMMDNIYLYVKDRYFIGEHVETYDGSTWRVSHVLQVVAPSKEESKEDPSNPTKFKYEVEYLDSIDEDVTEMFTVNHSQIRRKKGTFNKERCRIFLKQHFEQNDRGIFQIKETSKESFGLNKIKYDKIFVGDIPNFETSKKLLTSPKKHSRSNLSNGVMNGNSKKLKQDTLVKFLKNGMKTNNNNGSNFDALERIRLRQEKMDMERELRKKKKLEMVQEHQAKARHLQLFLAEWQKPKDDLLLENQKKLPTPVPVKTKIPDEHLGDTLMVMEFTKQFAKILHTTDFFSKGLTLELMERALLEKEIAGPYSDIIEMFLVALFNAQNEESNQYRAGVEHVTSVSEQDLSENLNMEEASQLATIVSSWSKKHLGLPLSRLPLYSVMISEVLRLHLLSSGAIINESGSRWRYAQRGGYTKEDDPGLHFCLHHPQILKFLTFHNVVDLSINEKLQIISCLMNQLMTYVDIRDIIEENRRDFQKQKIELRSLELGVKRQKRNLQMEKIKLQKEHLKNENKEILHKKLVQLEKHYEDKIYFIQTEINLLKTRSALNVEAFLGCDRAYRKYLKLESVPGVLVMRGTEEYGKCLKNITKQNPNLMNPTKQELTLYGEEILFQSQQTNHLIGDVTTMKDLDMCTTKDDDCPVHSRDNVEKWYFFSKESNIEELEKALNKRGERERKLLQIVEENKEKLMNLVRKTPVQNLNSELEFEEDPVKIIRKIKDKYEDANLGYPVDMPPDEVLENVLLETVLEMEEKIFNAHLGHLNIENRDNWRKFLSEKQYEQFQNLPIKNNTISNNKQILNEETKYSDPGKYLLSNNNDKETKLDVDFKKSVKTLALALAQVARSLDSKCLKKPLGLYTPYSQKGEKMPCGILDKWEQSLLNSTSYSQIFVHYRTLDSCIMWSRSVLLTKCCICRRQKDAENMLLCDRCHLGHHLYCLKPTLSSVPKGDWFCYRCRREKEEEQQLLSPDPPPAKKRRIFYDEDVEEEENDENVSDDDEFNQSDNNSESDDESIAMELCTTCGSGGEVITCDTCTKHYHIECCEPPLRRPPRGVWICSSCKEKEMHSDSDEVIVTRRNNRREENRNTLPLHNVELQELLSDIMKQDEAWPFLRPVQIKEVPDYYDVISDPMDFGTIKYKLNMGKYSVDSQLMQDVALVFKNCDTYNNSEAEVYKCGVKLMKYFVKKAKELGLKLPEEMDNEEVEQQKKHKRRLYNPHTSS